VAETLPQVHGGSGELEFYRAYPPLVNWDAQTDFAMKVAQDVFGADQVDSNTPPHGGAEDFSFYLQKVPGCYLFVGNGGGEHRDARYEGRGPASCTTQLRFQRAAAIGSTYRVAWCGSARA
jgi:hippurate hydrolase